MEAIGTLSGGVAHDFNNILTVIKGYTELLLGGIQDTKLRALVSYIDQAAGRASDLTRQLLAYSRRQVLQPKIINLNALVFNLDKMLQRVIGEDIEMRTIAAPNLGSVKADPGQIEQVIINLAVNARDAMPKGGNLTLETANASLEETYARKHPGSVAGRYVLLAVSHTGFGMDAATRSRIFEPFFTTKAIGRGTGLGLSMVYGIVQQSGGSIEVYSESGREPLSRFICHASKNSPSHCPRQNRLLLPCKVPKPSCWSKTMSRSAIWLLVYSLPADTPY